MGGKRETVELVRSQLMIYLMRVIKIVEHNTYTANHSDRVAGYSSLIGTALGLKDKELSMLWRSALLHDVGKVGISPDIIMAPRRLTKKEFNEIKKHTIYGEQILSGEFLIMESRIVRQHHEHFNGKGYPDGLKGKNIHLFARIISVADVFDSLIDNRPYRKAWPMQQAADYVASMSSSMFDPKIAGVFFELASAGKFNDIQKIEGYKL